LKETYVPRVNRKVAAGTREWADHNINCIIVKIIADIAMEN